MTTNLQPSHEREFVENLVDEIMDITDGDEAEAVEYMKALVGVFGAATAITRATLSSRTKKG